VLHQPQEGQSIATAQQGKTGGLQQLQQCKETSQILNGTYFYYTTQQ
jgi:hypothetical protein